MKFASAGDKMFCMWCGDLLWEWAIDVNYGDKTGVYQIKPGIGQKWINGQDMICQKCNKPIGISTPIPEGSE